MSDIAERLKAIGEIEDMIEQMQRRIDKYGIALMMIAEGCADPQNVARLALEHKP